MHDGQFRHKVLDHYMNNIITVQPTLDPLLKNRIALTLREKNELVYFLYTLTDSSFLDLAVCTGNVYPNRSGKEDACGAGYMRECKM